MGNSTPGLPGRRCPDCQVALRRVQLIASPAPASPGSQALPVEYAAWDGKTNWLGRPRAEGLVEHWLCPRCDRLLHYARPLHPPGELTPAAPPEGSGDEPTPSA